MHEQGQLISDPAAVISAVELNAWLTWLLDKWAALTEAQGAEWLALPSGNPAFSTAGALFEHAFTPLHRYSDNILGQPFADTPDGLHNDWPALLAWSRRCLERHLEADAAVRRQGPDSELTYKTRSAGEVVLKLGHAHVHAATHCAWHLAGITHLLRAAGYEPPQRSDLLFWAMEQHAKQQ